MAKVTVAAILSFTEIDAHDHFSFNRWHRYVHQPELFLIEGIVGASRLVATPELLTRRYAASDILSASQYFGYYLLSEPIAATFAAMAEFGPREVAKGRGHVRRGPSSTSRLAETHAAPGVLSSPLVMPFRPHQGMYVTVDDPRPGARAEDVDVGFAYHERIQVPRILRMPGVAGCWTFEYLESYADPATSQMAQTIPDRRATRLYWLEGDPETFLDALDAAGDQFESATSEAAYHCVLRSAYREIRSDSQFEWFSTLI